MRDKAGEWEDKIKAWSATRALIEKRLPAWNIVGRLAKHTAEIPEAKPHLDQIDAIRSQRLLLESADSANTVRQALAGFLRDAVKRARRRTRPRLRRRMRRWPQTGSGPSCRRPIRAASNRLWVSRRRQDRTSRRTMRSPTSWIASR